AHRPSHKESPVHRNMGTARSHIRDCATSQERRDNMDTEPSSWCNLLELGKEVWMVVLSVFFQRQAYNCGFRSSLSVSHFFEHVVKSARGTKEIWRKGKRCGLTIHGPPKCLLSVVTIDIDIHPVFSLVFSFFLKISDEKPINTYRTLC